MIQLFRKNKYFMNFLRLFNILTVVNKVLCKKRIRFGVLSIVLFFLMCIFVCMFNQKSRELKKNLREDKILIQKIECMLCRKHRLNIINTSGSTTKSKGLRLYYLFECGFLENLDRNLLERKFLIALLDILHIINTNQSTKKHQIERPFTAQNLVFSILSAQKNQENENFNFLIKNNFGEVEIGEISSSCKTLNKYCDFPDFLKKFQFQIPEYLRESVKQTVNLPQKDREEILLRNDRLSVDDSSI